MRASGYVTAGAIATALAEFDGAVIDWQGNAPADGTEFYLPVEVLDNDAVAALPHRAIERLVHDFEEEAADELADFIRACLAGDRPLAAALAARVFESDVLRDTAERILTPLRRVA